MYIAWHMSEMLETLYKWLAPPISFWQKKGNNSLIFQDMILSVLLSMHPSVHVA